MLVDELTEDQKEKTMSKWGCEIKINEKTLLLAGIDEKAEICDEIGECNVYNICLESEDKEKQYGIYANGKMCETCRLSYFERYM